MPTCDVCCIIIEKAVMRVLIWGCILLSLMYSCLLALTFYFLKLKWNIGGSTISRHTALMRKCRYVTLHWHLRYYLMHTIAALRP